MSDLRPGPGRALALVLAGLLLVGCDLAPSATPTMSASPSPSLAASTTPAATATGQPTATPEPELSLDLPPQSDERQVEVSVEPEVAADGDGRITVTVTNLSPTRVVELVLRWPTSLGQTLFLAPFEPSQARIANGGPPLLQDWTKWVEGPGENGEPAGTTSLGWGPLDPGATLTIPIMVTRRAAGPAAFDLQVLAGESILTLSDAEPAELRVEAG